MDNYQIKKARRLLDNGKHLSDRMVDSLLNHKKPAPKRSKKPSRKRRKEYQTKKRLSDIYVRGLRYRITKHERMVKDALNKEHVLFVSQQRFIGQGVFYIVDFYFKLADGGRLVVEIDGASHLTETQKIKDAKRDAYFEGRNISVLRFTNLEVEENLDHVLDSILDWNPKCWDNML